MSIEKSGGDVPSEKLSTPLSLFQTEAIYNRRSFFRRAAEFTLELTGAATALTTLAACASQQRQENIQTPTTPEVILNDARKNWANVSLGGCFTWDHQANGINDANPICTGAQLFNLESSTKSDFSAESDDHKPSLGQNTNYLFEATGALTTHQIDFLNKLSKDEHYYIGVIGQSVYREAGGTIIIVTYNKGENVGEYNLNLNFCDAGNFRKGAIGSKDTTAFKVNSLTNPLRLSILNMTSIHNGKTIRGTYGFVQELNTLKQNVGGLYSVTNPTLPYLGGVGITTGVIGPTYANKDREPTETFSNISLRIKQ